MAEAFAGDIVMAAGLSDIYIGETICSNEAQAPLPAINIDEPTISLNFLVNDFPASRPGRKIRYHQADQRTIGKRTGNKCRPEN